MMKKHILAGLLVLGSLSGAAAKGGMQTWILVCSKGVPQGECNLTTASRWYHLPSAQPGASSPAIKAARAKVGEGLEAGFYVSQEQFPAGVSMGARGNVFKACDDAAAPADSQAAEWAQRGACLR
jgi:hypothetical protein